jgi:hypothetical protein
MLVFGEKKGTAKVILSNDVEKGSGGRIGLGSLRKS